MSWASEKQRKRILVGLALAAIAMQATLELTKTPKRQRAYDQKLEAAQLAERAFEAIRLHRLKGGEVFDDVSDPSLSGLIGLDTSVITNATGNLHSKLTTINPNFAGLLVDYFLLAGLGEGDLVAVAASGSFPAMNICLYAAMETLDLTPVVTCSVGASNWGANDPAFTWLDMEKVLVDRGVFSTRSIAASHGGGDDMGRGLIPAGKAAIVSAMDRNGVDQLVSSNLDDAIARRMGRYSEEARGRRYRAYVNVGGGLASLGSAQNKSLIAAGLSRSLEDLNYPLKGCLILMAEKGIPVIHLLKMEVLAARAGFPEAPEYAIEPGDGWIFTKEQYRIPLAAVFFAVYVLACVLLLAPEARRGLLGRRFGKVDGDSI